LNKIRRREEHARRRASKRSLRDELAYTKRAEKERIEMMRRAQKLGLAVATEEPAEAVVDEYRWLEESGVVDETSTSTELFDWRTADLPEPLPDRVAQR
jgi:hypothetical protein